MNKFWGLTLSILFLNLQLFSLGCSTLKTQSSYVLNAKTNWARSTLKKDYLGPKLIHSMAPTLIEDTIYQGNAADGLVAIDQKSGHIRWRKDIKNGVNSGAVESKGVIYFGGNDGQFYALKASNGHMVWTFPTQAETLSAPVLDGNSIYFLADNGTIYSLNANTGKMNWSYTQRDNAAINIRASSSPVIDGAFVYVGFSDGTFSCFDKNKGFLKWERNLAIPQERFKDIGSTAVIQNDSIYISTYSGNLFSIKKTNGEINWKTEEGSPYAVTIEGNKIFYSTTNKKVLALDRQTGKELWTFNVKSGVATQPTYYKEMLIFGTSEGAVEIVSSNDGKLIGHYSTGWGVSAPITVNSTTSDIYIMSNYGNIYSVNLKWQRPQQQWPWEK
jgi:outer membrane protein assembly factor BamB